MVKNGQNKNPRCFLEIDKYCKDCYLVFSRLDYPIHSSEATKENKNKA